MGNKRLFSLNYEAPRSSFGQLLYHDQKIAFAIYCKNQETELASKMGALQEIGTTVCLRKGLVATDATEKPRIRCLYQEVHRIHKLLY